MRWIQPVLAIVVCSFLVSTAHATLLVYDGFEYTSGQNLSGQTNVAFGRTWDHTGSTNNSNLFSTIGSASLAVPISGSPGNDLLAKAPFGTAADRIGLGTTINTNSTTYYSLALKVNTVGSATTNGSFIAGFNNSTGTQTAVLSVAGARLALSADPAADPSKYRIGITNNSIGSATPASYSPALYDINTTYFLVASYEINGVPATPYVAGTDDVARIWINPDLSTFDGLTGASATFTGNDILNTGLASFFFRRTGGLPDEVEMDELRVGTAYQDVIPEPASLSAVGLVAGHFLLRRGRRRLNQI